MNESDLRAALPPERRLPADRRNDIKEMLMHTAHEESSPIPGPSPRRRRRRVAGGVAVALAVAGLGTAAAATVLNRDRPDPREAEMRRFVDADIDELNRLRSFDVSFLAVPADDGCAEVSVAVEWARERIVEFGGGLSIEVMDEGVGCYRGVVDWTRQVVLIQAIGPQP